MEQMLQQLLEGQQQLLEGQKLMNKYLDKIEGQLQEHIEYLKALPIHQSEHQKIDQLVNTTAHIEGEVRNIRTDIGAVETITAKNWNDIIQLRINYSCKP